MIQIPWNGFILMLENLVSSILMAYVLEAILDAILFFKYQTPQLSTKIAF